MSEKPTVKKEPKKTPEPKGDKVEKPAFKLVEVNEKPSRKYRKGSKYDPVIDKFIAEEKKLVTVEIEGAQPNYLATQIQKRIKARKLESTLDVSVVNNKTYLEKKA